MWQCGWRKKAIEETKLSYLFIFCRVACLAFFLYQIQFCTNYSPRISPQTNNTDNEHENFNGQMWQSANWASKEAISELEWHYLCYITYLEMVDVLQIVYGTVIRIHFLGESKLTFGYYFNELICVLRFLFLFSFTNMSGKGLNENILWAIHAKLVLILIKFYLCII